METQLCSMCQREWAPLAPDSAETDRMLEELTGAFEVPRHSFRGSSFCADCRKLLALTHQISIKIRKRKQTEESAKQPNPALRKPSVAPNEGKLSLAKRMRMAQQAARNRDQEPLSGSNETKENLCLNGKNEVVSVGRRSDDEEYSSEQGGECSRSYRARSRSL